jgi:prophage regulatory protein
MWGTKMADLKLERLPNVLGRNGRSRSELYRKISEGTHTPPVRVGSRCAAWPSHEIDALIAADIAGATDEQRRQLVERLLANRSALMPSMATGHSLDAARVA